MKEWFNAAYEGDVRTLNLYALRYRERVMARKNERGVADKHLQVEETRSGIHEQFFHYYYEDYYGDRIEATVKYYGTNVYALSSVTKTKMKTFTALEYAAIRGNFQAVRFLLRIGCDPTLVETPSAIDFVQLVQNEPRGR